MWLAWDLRNLYFPDPVFLKRLAAALHVLILGILSSPVLQFQKKRWWYKVIKHNIPPYIYYVSSSSLAIVYL